MPQVSVKRTVTYPVAHGDSWETIALRFFGNRDAWKRVVESNQSVIDENHGQLRPGMMLTFEVDDAFEGYDPSAGVAPVQALREEVARLQREIENLQRTQVVTPVPAPVEPPPAV